MPGAICSIGHDCRSFGVFKEPTLVRFDQALDFVRRGICILFNDRVACCRRALARWRTEIEAAEYCPCLKAFLFPFRGRPGPLWFSDAADGIHGGMSGSPVLLSDGSAIGVVSAGGGNPQGGRGGGGHSILEGDGPRGTLRCGFRLSRGLFDSFDCSSYLRCPFGFEMAIRSVNDTAEMTNSVRQPQKLSS